MDKSFWLEKWQAHEIGFHLADFHPLLQKYHSELFSSGSGVFVPLCGKTRDMSFLQSQGYSVLGCELSEIAAEEYFAEETTNSVNSVAKTDSEKFISYHQQNTKILVGDIFDLSLNETSHYEFIYDRAALIALPKDTRKKYVTHLRKIIPSATMLLITLDYDQQFMSGPPFSVTQEDVNQLFSFASVELLHRKNIIDQEPRFRSKGLQAFNQNAYRINW